MSKIYARKQMCIECHNNNVRRVSALCLRLRNVYGDDLQIAFILTGWILDLFAPKSDTLINCYARVCVAPAFATR